jgi:hypothetical protein
MVIRAGHVQHYQQVGIIKPCCNGIPNKQLLYSFKMITSYKNSGSKSVKSFIDCYKIHLKALKSYKVVK